jgi:hypothetical protein
MSSSTDKPRHPTDAPIPFPTIRMTIGPRLKDAEYDSLALLLAAYESHSYDKGYGVVLADSQGLKRPNKLGRRVAYRCDWWGSHSLERTRTCIRLERGPIQALESAIAPS